MQLTLHTDYALRILLMLGSSDDGWVSTSEIARAFGISAHHVAKIAKELTRLGLLEAKRGAAGGVRLARPPAEIVLGDLVRAMEPSLALVECQGPDNTCPITRSCALKSALGRARAAFLEVLDASTLEEMLYHPRRLPVALRVRR